MPDDLEHRRDSVPTLTVVATIGGTHPWTPHVNRAEQFEQAVALEMGHPRDGLCLLGTPACCQSASPDNRTSGNSALRRTWYLAHALVMLAKHLILCVAKYECVLLVEQAHDVSCYRWVVPCKVSLPL